MKARSQDAMDCDAWSSDVEKHSLSVCLPIVSMPLMIGRFWFDMVKLCYVEMNNTYSRWSGCFRYFMAFCSFTLYYFQFNERLWKISMFPVSTLPTFSTCFSDCVWCHGDFTVFHRRGRNRQLRRMCKAVGLDVEWLMRPLDVVDRCFPDGGWWRMI